MKLSSLNYQIDEWLVSPQLFRLDGPSGRRTLEPKVMQLLLRLIAADGELVTKEELVESVWEGNRVADSALTRGMSELRRALGDNAANPRFIETIPTRGYRLVQRALPTESQQPETHRESRRRAMGAALALVVLFGSVLAWRSRDVVEPFSPEAPPMSQARLMQTTAAPGIEAFPDYSPDGGRVVYSAEEGGGLELYVQQLSPGASRLQLTNDGRQNVQASWSPDGLNIAYHSVSAGGIWVIPALGGESRRVSASGSSPEWLSDSRTLVFQSGTMVDLHSIEIKAHPPSTLWTVDIREGRPQPLTRRNRPLGGHGAARVSPDGSRIAFSSNQGMGGALFTMRVDGTDIREVAGAPKTGAVFSADGRYVYSVGPFQGNKWLWRTRIAPDGEALAPAERVVRGLFREISFSPGGDRLIASSMERRSHLYKLALDPVSRTPVAGEEAITKGTSFRDTSPVISPSGDQVAYRQRRVGQRDQIWLVDADGQNNVQLTLDPNVSAHFPSWTDDGRGILFQSFGDGLKELVHIGLDNRDAEARYVLPTAWQSLRISRDGSFFTFHSLARVKDPQGNSLLANNVFVARTDDLEPKQITLAPGFAGYPVISPASKKIAFEIEDEGKMQLFVQTLDPGSDSDEPRQLTYSGHNWTGAFATEDQLAFVAQRDGIWNLYLVDTETGEETQLTNNTQVTQYYRNPDVSADGNLLVFERGSLTSDLWQVMLEG